MINQIRNEKQISSIKNIVTQHTKTISKALQGDIEALLQLLSGGISAKEIPHILFLLSKLMSFLPGDILNKIMRMVEEVLAEMILHDVAEQLFMPAREGGQDSNKTPQLDSLLSSMMPSGLTPNSLNQIIACMNALMDEGFFEEIIDDDSMQSMSFKKELRKKLLYSMGLIPAFSHQTAHALLHNKKYANSPFHLTGMDNPADYKSKPNSQVVEKTESQDSQNDHDKPKTKPISLLSKRETSINRKMDKISIQILDEITNKLLENVDHLLEQ